MGTNQELRELGNVTYKIVTRNWIWVQGSFYLPIVDIRSMNYQQEMVEYYDNEIKWFRSRAFFVFL